MANPINTGPGTNINDDVFFNGPSYDPPCPPGVFVVSSSTIAMSGSGSTCDPLSASVILSTINGNILRIFADGLYASGTTAPAQFISGVTNPLLVTGGNLSLKVSSTLNNSVQLLADGIYVSGNTGTVTTAANGLSLSGTTVVLGGSTFANIVIDMTANANSIWLKGGKLRVGGSGSTAVTNELEVFGYGLFKAKAGKLTTTPYILFKDSTDAETGRINFNDLDVYIGRSAGILDTNTAKIWGNVGIGQDVLSHVTSASDGNVAIGYAAMRDSVSAILSVAIGFKALLVSNGVGSTAVGQQALRDSTTGQNTAIGSGAGAQLTTGDGNICIGAGAMANQTISNSNLVIGNDSLDLNGGSTGDDNIIIGNNSVTGHFTYGRTNIVIGSLCNNGSPAGSIGNNNISIGAGINLFGGLSNTCVIIPGGSFDSIIVSNVIVLGNSTHNTILGANALTLSDSGDRLQIYGTALLSTLPTTSGATTPVAWDNTTHRLVAGLNATISGVTNPLLITGGVLSLKVSLVSGNTISTLSDGIYSSGSTLANIRNTSSLSETFTVNDFTVNMDSTAGDANINLTPASLFKARGNIKKISSDTNVITITATAGLIYYLGTPASTMTFDGQGENIQFHCDGVNIYIQ